MDNERERVDYLAVEHDVELDELAGNVVLELVVKGRVAACARLEGVEEVVDYLGERQDVVQIYSVRVDVLHVDKGAASVLTELHDVADVLLGGIDVRVGDGLLGRGDERRVGVVRRVVDHLDGTVGARYAVDYARRCGDEVEHVLALKAFLNDLHVEQSEEAAAEAEAERDGGLSVERESRVV